MIPDSPIKNSLLQNKGIEPAKDFEDININPTITYRHILSQNLGVRDPFRVIALCDSDAFYANCEMVRLGVDPDTPLVVLQWDSVIAVNYPARKYGVSRMDKKKDALKRCPHLKVVHVATYREGDTEPGYWEDVDTNTHKVSLDHYRRESMKIATMFKEHLTGCEVEKASIDEIFIDFTKVVREILLQRYPYLAQVPAEALAGVDTPLPPPPPVSWNDLGSVIPFDPQAPETCLDIRKEEETSSTQQDEEDTVLENLKADTILEIESQSTAEEQPPTWHDVALSIAAAMMQHARDEVRIALGYSTSAGIARNKFLAKLTASYKKPNNQTILRNKAIPNYLKPVQFQKIRFLGGKLGKAIAEEYDASTVGDLLSIELEELQQKFGEESIWVYEFLRGIDRTEVKDKGSAFNKSMLASKNLPKPITKPEEGQHWIRVLAAELALRLNDARQVSPNLWPKTLVLHAKKGYETARSKQAPFPFTKEVTVDTIASAGNKLWKELVGNQETLKVTSVHLAFTGIEFAESGQRTIEGFLLPSSSKKRLQDEGLVDGREPVWGKGVSETKATYSCPRCGKAFYSQAQADLSADEDRITDPGCIAKAKLEHEDFHFAQDLANEGKSRSSISISSKSSGLPPSGSSSAKRRKPPSKPNGIEKFFGKS